MYADIIQGDNKLRPKFLHSLFKPFEDACSLAVGSRAAASDPHLLAFCAHLAAGVPCKRGDEPLTMLHCINSIVSRLGYVGLDKLKVLLIGMGLQQDMGLDLEEVEDAGRLPVPKGPHPAGSSVNNSQHAAAGVGVESGLDMQAATAAAGVGASSNGKVLGPQSRDMQHTEEFKAVVKASLALSMLLVLKQYLMAAYGLSDDRVAQFELKGEKKRAEERAMVSKRGFEFTLDALNLR
jgi:cohesin loading factor subunit SCC2